jgi:predicted short-subunit dehydrogenase-like oxidoreductase (DUF2520 family)
VADVTLITTPDDKIASVVLQLATHAKWRSGDVVLHCSGLYTSDSLSALRAKGCWVASVHPLRSFAVPCLSVQAYPGTFCAIEGDESALPLLHEWFAAIGSVPFNIPKAGKALYHAGSVFASNYLITLAVEAKTCFEAAGIEPGLVADLISQLMQSAVTNLRVSGMFCESLTGPLARGDLATVKNHLTALPSEQRELYKILAKATLPMTTLTALQRNDLTAVLNQ